MNQPSPVPPEGPKGEDWENWEASLEDEENSMKMPKEARPIFVAAILSFLWVMFLSPALAAGFGPSLSDEVIRSGQGQFETCQRKFSSLGTTFGCSAMITWSDGQRQSATVTSTQNLTGKSAEVVERSIRYKSRQANPDNLRAGKGVIVTAEHGHSEWSVWWLRLIGGVVIWAATIFFVENFTN